jgi:hypothetical protein
MPTKPCSYPRSGISTILITEDKVFIPNPDITSNAIILITENSPTDHTAKSYFITLQPSQGFTINASDYVFSNKTISWFIVYY